MNVLILGGAGFIGSHFANKILHQPGCKRVLVYDNFSSGTTSHLSEVIADPKLEVVNADIKHLGMLTQSMSGIDLVAHFASNPDIAKAARQPDIDFWEGTFLTHNVLEAMRVAGVKKLAYASGSGVYGEDPGQAFSEDYGPCMPISTYGASKIACEALICSYCHMFSMTARAFRFANVVGPRQTHGVGYDFLRRLSEDRTRLKILGDGTQTKSYIHVDDVLQAILQVVNKHMRPELAYDVYNVATDDYITVKEIAEMATEVMGIPREKIVYEFSGGDRGWRGDVPKILFDTKKIKSLGWRTRRSSREAMVEALHSLLPEAQG